MYGALRKSWSMATRLRKLRAQPVEFPDNERVTVNVLRQRSRAGRSSCRVSNPTICGTSVNLARVPIRGEKYRVEQNRSRSSSVRGFTLLDLQ